jgi:hypothetical protein
MAALREHFGHYQTPIVGQRYYVGKSASAVDKKAQGEGPHMVETFGRTARTWAWLR